MNLVQVYSMGQKLHLQFFFEKGLFLSWVISQAAVGQCDFVYWESLGGTALNLSMNLGIML